MNTHIYRGIYIYNKMLFCMTSERSGNIKQGKLTVRSQAVGLTQYGLSRSDEKRSETENGSIKEPRVHNFLVDWK